MLIMAVTDSDENVGTVATRFLLKVTKRSFQQKVHSSVTCFKKVDVKQYILK